VSQVERMEVSVPGDQVSIKRRAAMFKFG